MSFLPESLQPYAKAITPFVLTIIAVIGHWLGTGEFNRSELAMAITGALSSLVTYTVPNYEVDHYENAMPDEDDSIHQGEIDIMEGVPEAEGRPPHG